MKHRATAIYQTLIMVFLSALVGVLAKLALGDVPPLTFVWLMIAMGGCVLSLYIFGLRGERVPRGLGPRVWAYIIWIGICNFSIVRVFFMLSLERLPATTHAYLIGFVGIVTMLMSVAILRERPSLLQVIGTVAAVAGLRVFFGHIPPPSEMTGVLYVGIAILALASTNNIARKLAQVTGNSLSNNVISTVALWVGGFPWCWWGSSRTGHLPWRAGETGRS